MTPGHGDAFGDTKKHTLVGRELAVKKGCLHVKLSESHVEHRRKSKNHPDGRSVGNRREREIVVAPKALAVAAHDQASFVSFDAPMAVPLYFEDPLRRNRPRVWRDGRQQDNSPHLTLAQGSKLLVNRFLPVVSVWRCPCFFDGQGGFVVGYQVRIGGREDPGGISSRGGDHNVRGDVGAPRRIPRVIRGRTTTRARNRRRGSRGRIGCLTRRSLNYI